MRKGVKEKKGTDLFSSKTRDKQIGPVLPFVLPLVFLSLPGTRPWSIATAFVRESFVNFEV